MIFCNLYFAYLARKPTAKAVTPLNRKDSFTYQLFNRPARLQGLVDDFGKKGSYYHRNGNEYRVIVHQQHGEHRLAGSR
jgi:hypothetical protein